METIMMIHTADYASVSVGNHNYRKLKEVKSLDFIMKKAGFNLARNGGNVDSGRFFPTKRRVPSSCGSKVKILTLEESFKLSASHRTKRQFSNSLQKQRNSWEEKKKKKNLSNALLLRAIIHKPTRHNDERRTNQVCLIPVMQQNHRIAKVCTPREKVLKVLHHFKLVFEQLDHYKATRQGESKTATSRIDYETRTILMRERKQVNAKKMIGPVPGIDVGDEFQFKSELNLIGLHFNIRGGIDYMNKGDLKLDTSIVSSEGNGYNDKFDYDVIIYYGQGGNVTSKNHKVIEDQKLVTGNLALANSMSIKTPVRVIRGKKRTDHREKFYVYDGLYLVQEYWRERRPEGNILFKFKLCRVSGQPFGVVS